MLGLLLQQDRLLMHFCKAHPQLLLLRMDLFHPFPMVRICGRTRRQPRLLQVNLTYLLL